MDFDKWNTLKANTIYSFIIIIPFKIVIIDCQLCSFFINIPLKYNYISQYKSFKIIEAQSPRFVGDNWIPSMDIFESKCDSTFGVRGIIITYIFNDKYYHCFEHINEAWRVVKWENTYIINLHRRQIRN